MLRPEFSSVRRVLAACVALCLAAVTMTAQSPTTVAVIAHPGVSQSNLTTEQLRDILMGEQQHWPGGARITVIRPSGGEAWTLTLTRILHLSASAYARQVDRKHYAGEWSNLPRVVEPATERRKLVAATPGAVSIVSSADVDASVKVITVDGLQP